MPVDASDSQFGNIYFQVFLNVGLFRISNFRTTLGPRKLFGVVRITSTVVVSLKSVFALQLNFRI